MPRTREGYYHCTAGIEVRFSATFVPDLIVLISAYRWPSSELLLSLRTQIWFGWRQRLPTWRKRNPSLAGFGNSILESWCWLDCYNIPQSLTALPRWLVYNLSPSFNWGAHGFTGQSTKRNIVSQDPDSSRDSRTRFEIFRSRTCQGRVSCEKQLRVFSGSPQSR